jgi:hypothetical protein
MGGIGKPTTLGKIERWHRTYMMWKDLDSKDMNNLLNTIITKEGTYIIELHDIKTSV